VARKEVVLGLPFGEITAEFDRLVLADEETRGLLTGWRQEHLRHRIPTDEIRGPIVEAASSHNPKNDFAVVWT